MDDPVMLILIAIAVVAIIVAFVVKNKKASSADDKKYKKGKTAGKKQKADKVEQAEHKDEEDSDENLDWDTISPTAVNVVDDTKVSVQDVDALTEFNVYKQFGYYSKAAESLSAYMEKTQQNDGKLASELVDLWLQAKNVDAAASALMQYQKLLSEEEVAKYVKEGLAIDENHLGLRVLAENRLGWSVQKTSEEIGKESTPAQQVETSQYDRSAETSVEAKVDEKKINKKPLVSGRGVVSNISNDEKGAVLAFMEPERGIKLLRNTLAYDTAIKYLNKAIRSSKKPASLLIDALAFDYRAKNINGFAGHLWNLYYSLGRYGNQVKERMLGWGYTLGHHPVFDKLETHPNELLLRDLGIQEGWLEGGSLKKAKYQPLVIEKADADAEPKTEAERILKEAESLLMYGQLDNSMELLEKAIVDHPQESQLYITLFDLYERAEEWERLEKLLQTLRPKVQTLPEEVVLAMSQLLQRFNNGSFGHK